LLVTLFSDASHCQQTGIVGYGGWVKSNRMQQGLQFKGVLKAKTDKTDIAEARAAVNVLYSGLQAGGILVGDEVLVQCDSLSALGVFTYVGGTPKQRLSPESKEIRDAVFKMAESFNLTFRTKHVKGHQPGDGSRFSVNNLCDQMAKEAMREARNKEFPDRSQRPPHPTSKNKPKPGVQRRERRKEGGELPEQSPGQEVGVKAARPLGASTPSENLSASERRRREIAAPVGAPDPSSLGRVGSRQRTRSRDPESNRVAEKVKAESVPGEGNGA